MKLPKYVYEMSTDELIKSIYRRIAVCGFDDSDLFNLFVRRFK